MISPYVRRLRLAQELRRLREAAGLTHAELAAQIKENRAKISRLENAHLSPDSSDVMKLLDALGVQGQEWNEILAIAQDAATRGWWESSVKAMGARQALYANLEAGAATICEYQQNFLPGLLHPLDYARARLGTGWVSRNGVTRRGVLEGRAGRQRMLRRPGGPVYEVVLDELAIRRPSAPLPVMAAALEEIAARAAQEKVTVRVLPIEAAIADFRSPYCTFSLYTYPDPGDPAVVAIEAATGDTVLTDAQETASYRARYELLRDASLPTDASLEMITQTAQRLSNA